MSRSAAAAADDAFGASADDGPSVDDTLAALADPIRRRTVELLAEQPRRAGDLADALGTTPSVMSKHLRVLRQRGIVVDSHPEFDARVRIYSLRSAPMVELRSWLDTAERGWSQQLASFAAHLEREAAGDDASARSEAAAREPREPHDRELHERGA